MLFMSILDITIKNVIFYTDIDMIKVYGEVNRDTT